MTPELQQHLEVENLRRLLPPITEDPFELRTFLEGRKALGPMPAIPAGEQVCIDLEWAPNPDIIGVGNEHLVVQIDWRNPLLATQDDVRQLVKEVIAACPVVYHHADADIRKMREWGFDVSVEAHKQLDDTMLAHAVLHSEEEHTLEYLVTRYGRLPQHKHLAKVALDVYNAADLVQTVLIWKHGILPELLKDLAAYNVYRSMSLAFLPQAIEGEEAGIRVNAPAVYPMYDKYNVKREQGRALAIAGTGWPINVNSPDDLKHQVFVVEGMPEQVDKKSRFGDEPKLTLDKDALATLRRLAGAEWDEDDEPTLEAALANIEAGVPPILEARYLFSGAQQLVSHYVMPCFLTQGEGDKLEILGVRERIYPDCRVHAQSTGRIGWVGPALSQYKGERLKLLMPDPGHVWIGHDWSNIETWLLGALARDQVILDAKAANWDTHTVNFCDMTGTPRPPILTKALHTAPECAAWREAIKWQGEDDLRRTFAKRYVYRLHYRGLAKNAGDIPGAKALGFNVDKLVASSEMYLGKHLALPVYWDGIEREADARRVVYTFMGRPRRLTSQYRNARNREACNHPMQGGVSDIWITTAILVKQAAPWARLVFGAFDSQWWQVPADRRFEFLAAYAPIVTREFDVAGVPMAFPASFKVREAA